MLASGLSSAEEVTDFSFLPALPQLNPGDKVLLDITRVSLPEGGERLFALGEQGIIVYSDDKGKNWSQASVPVSVTLTALHFSSSGQGWAAGHQGVILHSDDGGKVWERQLSGREIQAQIITLVTEKRKLIEKQLQAPEQSAARADMEEQFEELRFTLEDAENSLASGPSEPLLDIWFSDENRGLAVGAYGLLLSTEDGGKSWTLHPSYLDNADKLHFYAIAALSEELIFVCGEFGTFWRSRDAGKNWETLEPPYHGSLFGVLAIPGEPVPRGSSAGTGDGELLAFGLRGALLRSSDLGDSWQSVDGAQNVSLLGGSFSASGRLALVGTSGALLLSDENGHAPRLVYLPSKSTFANVIFVDDESLLLVGNNGFETWSSRAGEDH